MELTRPARRHALISIVPMIDVLLILLVFFMVTSSYLNLDLIPAGDRNAAAPPTAGTAAESGSTILIRLASDGTAVIAGQTLTPQALTKFLSGRLAEQPLTPVVVLPSPRASLQSLVTVMDTATAAGATRLRVIRLEGQP